jgi:hypothetical protein
MRTARRQFTGELKREAVGLLASGGRPLGQIARERGIAASRLRAWRDAGANLAAGPALKRRLAAHAYCAMPLPNDQFSFGTSRRFTKMFSGLMRSSPSQQPKRQAKGRRDYP